MPLGAILMLVFMTIGFGGFGLVILVIGISVGHLPAFLFGLIFASIGFTPLFIYLRKKWIKHKVIKMNMIIDTEFLDLIHAQYQINSFTPLIIRSQWFDEKNNLIYQFKSSPLSVDPSQYLYEELKIPVFINPDNPKEYYMDLTRIPDLKRVLYDN